MTKNLLTREYKDSDLPTLNQMARQIRELRSRHDYLAKVMDVKANSEASLMIDRDLYHQYQYLIENCYREPGEVQKEIGNIEESYVRIIREDLIANFFVNGRISETITPKKSKKKSTNPSQKELDAVNANLKAITDLFTDRQNGENILEKILEQKSIDDLAHVINIGLLDNLAPLENQTLSKNSMELISWHRALEALSEKVPSPQNTSIKKDLKTIKDLDISTKEGALNYTEILNKYHYESVLSNKKLSSFKATTNGLSYTQATSGSVDIGVIYRPPNSPQTYGIHMEPSNPPLLDVSDCETNSLSRHRILMMDEINSHESFSITEEDLSSYHVFVFDKEIYQIKQYFNQTGSPLSDEQEYLIKLIFIKGYDYKTRYTAASGHNHVTFKTQDKAAEKYEESKYTESLGTMGLETKIGERVSALQAIKENSTLIKEVLDAQHDKAHGRFSAFSGAILAVIATESENPEKDLEIIEPHLEGTGENKKPAKSDSIITAMYSWIQRKITNKKSEEKIHELNKELEEIDLETLYARKPNHFGQNRSYFTEIAKDEDNDDIEIITNYKEAAKARIEYLTQKGTADGRKAFKNSYKIYYSIITTTDPSLIAIFESKLLDDELKTPEFNPLTIPSEKREEYIRVKLADPGFLKENFNANPALGSFDIGSCSIEEIENLLKSQKNPTVVIQNLIKLVDSL